MEDEDGQTYCVQNNALLDNKIEKDIKYEKTHARSFRKGIKDKDYRQKFIRSLALCYSHFTLGIYIAQQGPSFLDIQLITGTDVEKASTFFTSGAVGYLCGSFISGILVDKFNKLNVLIVSVLFMTVTVSVTPLCSSYGLMLFIFWATAFCSGSVDTGGFADLTSIWEEAEGRPYFQALLFSFSFGGVISPLFTAPFLTAEKEGNPETNIENNISTFQNTSDSLSYRSNLTTNEHSKINAESRLIYAYLISGVLTLIAVILFLVIRLKFKPLQEKSSGNEQNSQTVKKNIPMHYYLLAIFILDLFFLLICGIEDMFAAFLSTFTVIHLKWSKQSASQLTSLFWGSLTLTRFLGIFFIGMSRPIRVLFINNIMVIFGLIAFSLCAYFQVHVGICIFTVIVGLSLSTMFATGFVWTLENLFEISGKVASSTLIAASIGAMINSLAVGYLIEEVNPMWYAYLLIIESVACIMILFGLTAISRFINSNYPRTKETTIPMTYS